MDPKDARQSLIDLPSEALLRILSWLQILNKDSFRALLCCCNLTSTLSLGSGSITPSLPSHKKDKVWESESFNHQAKNVWPGRGQHILAQFDEDSIVVYQAFNKDIADYATKHHKFSGCPSFGEVRMTWIKTNFLWMMFRSNWGSKHNQDHILAIWVKRDSFERYLENAREKGSVRNFKGTVRLQWDPDHDPNGERHVYRRAVQLGLKGVTSYIDGDDIVCIKDISPFVRSQARMAKAKKIDDKLLVAKERVFVPNSEDAIKAMQLSFV